jgi:hypothetical protein
VALTKLRGFDNVIMLRRRAMKLTTAKRKYRNQWIAFEFSDKMKETGKVVFHAKHKQEFHMKLMAHKGKLRGMLCTFTGSIVPRGSTVMVGPYICG